MSSRPGRDGSRKSLGAVSDEQREAKRRVFAGYGRCDECRALPGNPCRERSMAGNFVAIDRPHLVRQKDGEPS